ncbi:MULTISPECIES: class I SAM-dependent methyltransferase [unclassified Mesorhizobium]|uniref:class I SAM-dependent methyltransferase n=2 Tax=Mesorhizobium TaxID=68287 RepID=UPI0018DCB2F8|nr:class I SAM-dependent methyltransferase [Mesorhizobium sp. LSJC277A00]
MSSHYADQLEAAQRRLTGAGATNCEFVAGYALRTRYSGVTPRRVFTANAFDGVPDRPRLARAVREALAPGGHLLSSTDTGSRARRRRS